VKQNVPGICCKAGEYSDIPGKGTERVLDRVSTQNIIVADNQRGNHNREQPDRSPVWREGLVCRHRVCPSAPPDSELGQHGSSPDQENAEKVNKKICGASVGTCLIGESPDVPKADRRADRSQFKAGTGSKAGSFPVHGVAPFKECFPAFRMLEELYPIKAKYTRKRRCTAGRFLL